MWLRPFSVLAVFSEGVAGLVCDLVAVRGVGTRLVPRGSQGRYSYYSKRGRRAIAT